MDVVTIILLGIAALLGPTPVLALVAFLVVITTRTVLAGSA